jgi:hypothetical protein
MGTTKGVERDLHSALTTRAPIQRNRDLAGPTRGDLESTMYDRNRSGRVRISAHLQLPPSARACFVLAHGADAGMRHPFMSTVATGLANRDIATMRYQFPYMERGSKRPDPPKLAHATVRAAVAEG